MHVIFRRSIAIWVSKEASQRVDLIYEYKNYYSSCFSSKKAKFNFYNISLFISLIEFLILQLAVPDYIQQNKSYSETQDTFLNGKKFHMANISDFCRFQVNHNIQPEKSKSQNVKSG